MGTQASFALQANYHRMRYQNSRIQPQITSQPSPVRYCGSPSPVMALDAQRNWDVEMAQPLRLGASNQSIAEATSSTTSVFLEKADNLVEFDLPVEVIIQIMACIPQTKPHQKTFWACCLVSRSWYSAAVPFLYNRPYIGGSNFLNFVATVCPSKNAHIRRSPLSEFVKKLDMGELVHDGSRSLTARLLGRLKSNLTSFVAPQASFSIHSFAALSKCVNLTNLDLSLMSASISIRSLFKTLCALTKLQTLFFPRTASHDQLRDNKPFDWPPGLKALHLAGGIDDYFLRVHVCNAPKYLERISIQHCSHIYLDALEGTLQRLGTQLRQLTIRHPMAQLSLGSLNNVLSLCPKLTALCISADYVTDAMFTPPYAPQNHALRILELDCSSSAGIDIDPSPDAIWVAIDNGSLPYLRSVRVNARLAWTATETLRTSVGDLVDIMQDAEINYRTGVEPGVWSIIS